jgi:hypothetical protein
MTSPDPFTEGERKAYLQPLPEGKGEFRVERSLRVEN